MSDTEDRRKPEDIHDAPGGGAEPPPMRERPRDRPPRLTIRIDRREYRVPPELLHRGGLTGRQIRRLADPNIGPDRDLFEVVPGGSDRKIDDGETVLITNHMRFFSAPAVINPGAARDQGGTRPRRVDTTDGEGPSAAE